MSRVALSFDTGIEPQEKPWDLFALIKPVAALILLAAVIGFGVVYGALTTIAKEQWPDW